MSSLRKLIRNIDPERFKIARQVAEARIIIARQAVVDRAKKDAEFAADVLKAVGDLLPVEIKTACEESVKEAEAKKLLEKWDKTGLLEGIKDDSLNPPLAVLVESEEKQLLPEDTIHGNQITREQAYAGLGDPWTWETHRQAVMRAFEAKPCCGGGCGCDNSHELTEEVQLDGGGTIMVRPEEAPGYPKDGEPLAKS